MATAINQGLGQIKNKDFFVVWADMVYLKKKLLKKLLIYI